MKKSILALIALFLISTSVPALAAKNAGHGAKKETAKQSAAKTSGKTQNASNVPVTPHTDSATHETPCTCGCPVENEPASSQPAGDHSNSSNYDHTQNGTIPAPATGYPADYDSDNNSSSGAGSSSASGGGSDYDHTQNGTIPTASTGYPADYDNGGGSSSDDSSSSSSSSSSSTDSYDPYTGGGSDYNY